MNQYEVRLALVKHIAEMLFEMSDPEVTDKDEQGFQEDFEEFASHVIDSMQITVEESDGQTHKVSITPMPVQSYVDMVLGEEK